jgi:DNA-binding SARP family transcriptional activator/predicted transcriptional regulator
MPLRELSRVGGSGDVVEVRLLGEVAVLVDGRGIDLGPARQRCVLAALAVDVDRVVSVDVLAERVWGDHPPRRARATLVNYLSRLRQVLAAVDAAHVVRGAGGYSLEAGQSAVDLHRFDDLYARARTGDDRQIVALLEKALGLWRGEALTGLDGDWSASERDRLHQRRLNAEHDLTDALLRLGHGEDLVAGLSARVADNPLDERVAGQYMLALYRAGRAADALEHYRQVRERLVEELGTDPGEAAQQLHRRILNADPALTTAPAGTAPAIVAAQSVVVPRQLPAAPAPFVGRHDELDRLDATLQTGSDAATTVVISAIAGAGGIGKTWLALHWAHRHADRFPDGQLFVDLRGFSPGSTPMDPTVAVRGFLDALGVEPGRIPIAPHAQTALFRSLLAGRRMLLLLDNAIDTAQVAPLLPGGSATCTVVVTSRNRLSGLITRHGARHLSVDTLTDTEARGLLTARLGPARVRAEPEAVDELITLCGGFPLALSIIAGRAHTHPRLTLTALAAELRDSALDALDDTDPTASLPAVLSFSHRALTDEQAEAFVLLAIAPGPDIGLPAAASLTGFPLARTRFVLRALEQASLISEDAHGRYRMHDLVRRYATDTAHSDLSDEVRKAAFERVVDSYLDTAHAADQLLDPHRAPVRLGSPVPGVVPHPPTDTAAALAWFDTERANLIAAQHAAAVHHWHSTVENLARSLSTFLGRRGHLHDELTVWQAAADAVAHLPDPTAVVRTYRNLGYAHAALGHHEDAIEHLHQALALAEHHRDRIQQAHIHHALGWVWGRQRDDRQAMEHARRALDLYRGRDQPVREAEALNAVGWYATRLGQHDTARDHCEAALILHRHHHNLNGEANTLDSLGYIEHHNGRHHLAIDYYHHALTLHRELGNTYQVAHTLERLGRALAALCQHKQARTAWLEALALYREQGRDAGTARVQRQLDDLDEHDGG